MHARRPLVCILVAASAYAVCAPAAAGERTSAYVAAMNSVTSEELKEHVDYLADDAREGREAGTPGSAAAGDYLAEQLRQLQLPGAGADGGYFQPFDPHYRNVLAVLEGSDPQLKEQVIVVGAHYDHLGRATKRNSRGQVGQIHNGADDNASGTSGLLELAEAFTFLPEHPKRTILFAFWDAEEKGLLGSKHWMAHPTVPLEHVRIGIAADMIGRLRDERLYIYGTRCDHGLRRVISQANETPALTLDFSWNFRADSDHYSFCQREIAWLLIHTGMHEDYHRPTDDPATINNEGMRRVVQLLFGTVFDLADRQELGGFREVGRKESEEVRRGLLAAKPAWPHRLGVTWAEKPPENGGLLLSAVIAGSPADQAGIRPGDRIVRALGREITSGEDLIGMVMTTEKTLPIVLQRPGADQPMELTVALAGEPSRLAITWQADDAEPGSVLITHVVPGTPAAKAGLVPGDYIYQIGGRDFPDEPALAQWAASLPGPIQLLVEHEGKMRTVTLEVGPPPAHRAA